MKESRTTRSKFIFLKQGNYYSNKAKKGRFWKAKLTLSRGILQQTFFYRRSNVPNLWGRICPDVSLSLRFFCNFCPRKENNKFSEAPTDERLRLAKHCQQMAFVTV